MTESVNIWESEGIIKIKPKAYITMVKHVLAYGNHGLGSDSVEVMGICMGKEIGGNIVVYEAIPISHGGAIEVGFTPTDYAAFAQVDEEFAAKGNGLYACGWYHSHPGMKAFMSGVDIKNHLFYQKEQTPKGFAIVFDHEYFDETGHSGFKAFRLNDFTKGTSSDFHESKFEILPPDDLDVYLEVMSIIESNQAKKPIISEIGGLDADDSMWDMGDDSDAEAVKEPVEKVEAKSALDEITDAAKQGTDAFTKEFTQEFLKNFDQFKNDTTNATQKGATVMVDILASMKENVDRGVSRVKQYLEKILNNELESVNGDLTQTFEKMDSDQRKFNKDFSDFSKNVSDNIGKVVKDILSDKLDGVIGSVKEAAKNAEIVGNKSSSFITTLDSQQKILEDLKNSLESDTISVEKTIEMIKSKIGSESQEQGKLIGDSMDDIKDITSEISKLVEEISKKVQ